MEGRVQGVFFRHETQKEARKKNVSGWVMNLYDGRVEALFEGEEKNIKEIVDWCHQGPPGASVRNVVVKEEAYEGEFQEFSIAH